MKLAAKQALLRAPLLGPALRKVHLASMRLSMMLQSGGQSSGARLDALRRDVAKLLRVAPLVVAEDRQQFSEASQKMRLPPTPVPDAGEGGGSFHLRRFCLCCNETMPMLVDYQYSSAREDGSRVPNWRERLVCGRCGMNNRQRLVAKLVQQFAAARPQSSIYLMEQVTPIYEWVRGLPDVEVHGSEYLGHEYKGGDRVAGIRHEDVMDLSYPAASFDLIVSNDVMEHIPDPQKALHECFRVLKPGGAVIATFPFHAGLDVTVVRARLVGSQVEHLLPPQYHGNPVSADGSLVFHDFGWSLIGEMQAAGFRPAVCEMYASDEFGHLGPGLLVFRMDKPAQAPAVTPDRVVPR